MGEVIHSPIRDARPPQSRPTSGVVLDREGEMERAHVGALGMCIMKVTGMDAIQRWFVLLAVSGLFAFAATAVGVLADW